MFIKKTKDKKLFSLRDKFLNRLNKEIKMAQIESNEELLRESLKKIMKE